MHEFLVMATSRYFALIIVAAILMACIVLIISTEYLYIDPRIDLPLIGHEVDRSSSGVLARRNQSSTGSLSVSATEALPADEFGYRNDPACSNRYRSKVG